MAGAAALLTTIAVGSALIAGCSGDSSAASSTPNSASPPTAQVAPMVRSTPIRVQIPAIGVDSNLMDLRLQSDGTMEVPPAGFPAGWYEGAPTPGQLGPAIIAGHVDWGGQPGVFYHLRDLKPGNEVRIARRDGSVAVFRVTQVKQYPKDNFPTNVSYGDIDHAGLRLITCGGSFDRQAHSYEDNIVAFAELVGVK
jgi:sortase (surface protein transpeptidase)